MGMTVVQRLNEADLPEFRLFCEMAWKAKHPLIHDEDFFEYYYRRSDKDLNFAVAKDSETEEFLSACGYICASDSENPDVWISFIVSKKGAPLGLSLQLLEKVCELSGCRTIACNNIRAKTKNLYKFFGYFVGELTHYYRLNDSKEYFTLCKISHPQILTVCESSASLVLLENDSELDCFDFERFHENKPYKDRAYATKRYFKNLWFDYKVYALQECGNTLAILVLRNINFEGASVIRVVDFIGNNVNIKKCGQQLDRIMHEQNAEFCDWYAFGVADEIMASAGFCVRTVGDLNIVPNYLQPPLFENTDYTFFTSDTSNYTMFKADGDQDRFFKSI